MKRLLAVSAFVAIGPGALPAFSQQPPAMTAHFIDDGNAEGGPLDADVLQVGHHGSHNATTFSCSAQSRRASR